MGVSFSKRCTAHARHQLLKNQSSLCAKFCLSHMSCEKCVFWCHGQRECSVCARGRDFLREYFTLEVGDLICSYLNLPGMKPPPQVTSNYIDRSWFPWDPHAPPNDVRYDYNPPAPKNYTPPENELFFMYHQQHELHFQNPTVRWGVFFRHPNP